MTEWVWLKALLLPVMAWLLWDVIAKRGAALLTKLWERRAKQPPKRG